MYNLGKFIFWVLFKILFRFKVDGLKNIPKKGGFILASNHLSNLDPIFLGVTCPVALHFMAKEELFRNRFFSWVLHRVNAFPLKRGTADLSAIKEAIRRVRCGRALLIFPEGSRQIQGAAYQQYKEGVGFLAAKLDVPVVPALIEGTDLALAPGAKFIRPNIISVRFGRQISLERKMAFKDNTLKIMEAIRHLSCSKSN